MSPKTQQETPQQAIAGFRDAVLRGQWDEAFEYLLPDIRRALVGGVWLEAAYAAVKSKDRLAAAEVLTAMREKYESREPEDVPTEELISILHELLAWSDRHLPPDEQLDLSLNLATTEYGEFHIQEDWAKAVGTRDGKRYGQQFKCIDDRWYLA